MWVTAPEVIFWYEISYHITITRNKYKILIAILTKNQDFQRKYYMKSPEIVLYIKDHSPILV